MNILEKCSIKLAQAFTSTAIMGTGVALINFFGHMIKTSIIENPHTIAQSYGIPYGILGFTTFIYCIFSFLVIADEYHFIAAIKKHQERLIQIAVGFVMLNLLVNFIIPSFYPQNYLKELINYAPFFFGNLGIMLSLVLIGSSVKVFFSFDKWYFNAKNAFSYYLLKKKKEKLAREQIAKEKLEQYQKVNEEHKADLNLELFNVIMTCFAPEKNIEFAKYISSLKNSVSILAKETNDITAQAEVKLLMENNLPKIVQVYQATHSEEDRKSVLKALGQIDGFFKKFSEDIEAKKKFQNNLNVATELKYFSDKYGT